MFPSMFRGNQLLVLTDRKAPNFRIIAIDPAKPEENNWSDWFRNVAGKSTTVQLWGIQYSLFM